MLANLLTILVAIVFAGIFIYLVKRFMKSTAVWEKAYLNRFTELKNTLPPSPVFPAIIQGVDYPASGKTGNDIDVSAAIMYIQGNNLVLERVMYQKTPDKTQPIALINRPFNSLTLRLLSSIDAPVNFIVIKPTYELSGPIYTTEDGKKHATGLWLVPPSLFIVSDVDNNVHPLTGKYVNNPDAQTKLINALFEAGVKNLDS